MKRSLHSLLCLALLLGCDSTTPTDKNKNQDKDKDSERKDSKDNSDSTKGSNNAEGDEDESDEEDEGNDNEDPSTSAGSEEDDEESSSTGSGDEEGEGESDKEDDTSDGSTGDDSDKDSDKDPDEDSGDSGDSGDKDPGEDPCKKIKWGDKVKVGSIVPRGDTPGYWDQDADGTLDKEETQVGMCELHKTGKKCGVVIFGKENWHPCREGFRRIADREKKLKDAKMVVYGQYGRTTTAANKPQRARKVISGYLGNEQIAMISGENTLGFTGAPLMALIDLRTMKLLMFEVWSPEEQRRHHIDEMIEHCESLD